MTQLFDDSIKAGAPAIRNLLGRHETLELDFKQRAAPNKGGDKADRKVLGKALSAFANSMGGLIVWGVDCRKNADGVDQVDAFTPISGLAKFASDMRDWTVEALMPRHAGVRVEALDEGNDTGFLLINVERSERRPHRCEMGDKGYYRRAGASSREMEHFEIEDAFRRLSVPNLELKYSIVEAEWDQEHAFTVYKCLLMLSLHNISNISAEQAYIAVGPHYSHAADLARSRGIKARHEGDLTYFEVENSTIHPGTSRILAPLRFRAVSRRLLRTHATIERKRMYLRLLVRYGCLHSPMRSTEIEIGASTFVKHAPDITMEFID